MTLVVGALLQDNRYQIQAVLEETDIEVVYRAVHTYLDKTVLLRQLRDDVDWADDDRPSSRAIMVRLLRFSQCQHPCLGEMLDCFEEGGRVYLVLPTYGKMTMSHWLQTHGGVGLTELITHLRSLVDIFDKFHQNGLVYGLLTPESLHYRAETNELVVAAFSWRMFLEDLLGDRHRLSSSAAIDIQGLAYLAYRLLTGDVDTVNYSAYLETSPDPSIEEIAERPSSAGKPNSGGQGCNAADLMLSDAQARSVRTKANRAVEAVLRASLNHQTAESLTPTAWFTALEQAVQSEEMPTFRSEENSVHRELEPHRPPFSKSIFSPIFKVAPSYSGGHVLESAVLESSDSTQSVSVQDVMGNAEAEDVTPQSIDVSSEMAALNGEADADGPTLQPPGQPWLRVKRGLPFVLGVTSVVAALSGGLLGYAFRVQDLEQLEQSPLFGNEIFGREQEFPPSENWPGQNVSVEANPSVLFERAPTQQIAQPAPERAGDIVLSDGIVEPESVDPHSELPTAAPVVDRGLRYQSESEAPTLQNTQPSGYGTTPESSGLDQTSPEPSGPSKKRKPSHQNANNQNTNNNEGNSLPQPVTPDGESRINEMPPSVESSPQGSSSTVAPSNNRASTPTGVTPAKQPKLLITPISPPAAQNQGRLDDDMDISHVISSFYQS